HQAFAGALVLVEKGDKGALMLRQYDILTGKDLWKKTFAAKSIPLTSHDEGLAGAVQPDGKVTVCDLAAQKERFTTRMDPRHLAFVEKLPLFRDRRQVYVACAGPYEDVLKGSLTSNLMPETGLRSLPVNGELYAFDAATGELNWYNSAENLTIVLNHLD